MYKGYVLSCESITLGNTVTLTSLESYKPKTGDIVLFSNQKKPELSTRILASSYFTHVGLVYCDPKTNDAFILESIVDRHKTKNPLRKRITWYQQFRGNVCVRSLKQKINTYAARHFY